MRARCDQREENRDSKDVPLRTRLIRHISSCSWMNKHHISVCQQLLIFSFVHAMRYHRLTSEVLHRTSSIRIIRATLIPLSPVWVNLMFFLPIVLESFT